MLVLCALAIDLAAALESGNVTNESVTEAVPTSLPPPTAASEVTNISMSSIECYKWTAQYETYMQAMQAFLALTVLCSGSRGGRLAFRACIALAGACGVFWGRSTCAWDAVAWGGGILVASVCHLLFLLFAMRPVRFCKEIEDVYTALFLPLRVSRLEFRRVLRCMKQVKQLKSREVYAHEKVTKVDSLSLVLSGKLVVSQNQRALHIVFPHHFLDSPEWFGVSTDEYFQVSIMSMEESRVLIWHRDKLRLSIMSEPFLQSVFDHILGRDIVHKLMQVSDTMAANNGHIQLANNGCDDNEEKPMLVVKKNGDGPGITALLNRQLNAQDVITLTIAV